MPKYEFNISIEIEADNQDEASTKARDIRETIGKLPHVDDYETIYLDELIPNLSIHSSKNGK